MQRRLCVSQLLRVLGLLALIGLLLRGKLPGQLPGQRRGQLLLLRGIRRLERSLLVGFSSGERGFFALQLGLRTLLLLGGILIGLLALAFGLGQRQLQIAPILGLLPSKVTLIALLLLGILLVFGVDLGLNPRPIFVGGRRAQLRLQRGQLLAMILRPVGSFILIRLELIVLLVGRALIGVLNPVGVLLRPVRGLLGILLLRVGGLLLDVGQLACQIVARRGPRIEVALLVAGGFLLAARLDVGQLGRMLLSLLFGLARNAGALIGERRLRGGQLGLVLFGGLLCALGGLLIGLLLRLLRGALEVAQLVAVAALDLGALVGALLCGVSPALADALVDACQLLAVITGVAGRLIGKVGAGLLELLIGLAVLARMSQARVE